MKKTIRKVGSFLSCRSSEVLLAALLTVAMGVFGYGIRAQVTLQDLVKENALSIAKNEGKIGANYDTSNLQDKGIMDHIRNLKLASDESDAALIERIEDLKERLDQRCDTLENLLNLIYEGKQKGD